LSIFLEKKGYTNIINYEKGMLCWKENGYPLEGEGEVLESRLSCMPEFF
jgi:hypothetical protein